jgi:hypothetical protein
MRIAAKLFTIFLLVFVASSEQVRAGVMAEGAAFLSVGLADVVGATTSITGGTSRSTFVMGGGDWTSNAVTSANPDSPSFTLTVGDEVVLVAEASVSTEAPPSSFAEALARSSGFIELVNDSSSVAMFDIDFSYFASLTTSLDDPAFDTVGANVSVVLDVDDSAPPIIDEIFGPGESGQLAGNVSIEVAANSTVLLSFSAHVELAAASELPSQVIPEPSSLAIFGIGALGLVRMGWRRKRKEQA